MSPTTRSHWLLAFPQTIRQRAPVRGPVKADVAIVGAGFVGLWSAIFLKEMDPGLDIVVLEQNRAGHGASGMNGGFVMSWWPKIHSLIQTCGEEDALWLADRTTSSVHEIQDFLNKQNINADLLLNGWIWAATTEAHVGCWRGLTALLDRLGRSEVFREMTPGETAARTGSDVHRAGLYEAINGTVDPGKLSLALAAHAEALGVRIHEGSRVTGLGGKGQVQLITERGRVTADKAILAVNAWGTRFAPLRRSIFNVTSSVVATEPIPERLSQIGWTGGEGITDSLGMVNYYRTTRDGRIVFGKGGGAQYRAGGTVPQVIDAPGAEARTEAEFRRIFPMLADVKIARRWTGPIDRSYSGLPVIGTLPGRPEISYAVGWSGNGVNPSRIGARILAGLTLDRQDRWTRVALVNAKVRRFLPEPLQYAGGRMVRAAVARKDRADIAGTSPGWVTRRLVALAPSGVEDKID